MKKKSIILIKSFGEYGNSIIKYFFLKNTFPKNIIFKYTCVKFNTAKWGYHEIMLQFSIENWIK